MEIKLKSIIEKYDQYEWQYLKTREDLRALWSLDVMTYTIFWPGPQESPGFAYFFTNRGLAYAIDFVNGELNYDDLRSILPDLPENFEALRPWEMFPEYDKWRALNVECILNIKGWYWFQLYYDCWERIHESIWQTFYELTQKYLHFWLPVYWAPFSRKAIADREEQLEAYMAKLEGPKMTLECAKEEAREVAKCGIVAWRECDQGWNGLLCKNGKAYLKLDLDFETLGIPITHRMEIRNDMLPGWRCIYCGLGHRLIIREEYYPQFRKLTYGMGKNANLYRCGFAVLKNILEITE